MMTSTKFGQKYLSKADLSARGWTSTMVNRLLGKPDHTSRMKMDHGSAERHEYALARVLASERLIQEWSARLCSKHGPDRPTTEAGLIAARVARVEGVIAANNDRRNKQMIARLNGR